MKARVGERDDLMTPRVPGLRKSMAENDQWPCATLRVMHSDAIGLYEPMGKIFHKCSLPFPLRRRKVSV